MWFALPREIPAPRGPRSHPQPQRSHAAGKGSEGNAQKSKVAQRGADTSHSRVELALGQLGSAPMSEHHVLFRARAGSLQRSRISATESSRVIPGSAPTKPPTYARAER